MSHSSGLVRFKKDGKIVHSEYNGTVDIMRPKLFETFEEMKKYWREGQPSSDNCKCEPEKVEIYSTYGGGFYWEGKACRKCMELHNNFKPFSNNCWTTDGEPKWATKYYNALE